MLPCIWYIYLNSAGLISVSILPQRTSGDVSPLPVHNLLQVSGLWIRWWLVSSTLHICSFLLHFTFCGFQAHLSSRRTLTGIKILLLLVLSQDLVNESRCQLYTLSLSFQRLGGICCNDVQNPSCYKSQNGRNFSLECWEERGFKLLVTRCQMWQNQGTHTQYSSNSCRENFNGDLYSSLQTTLSFNPPWSP